MNLSQNRDLRLKKRILQQTHKTFAKDGAVRVPIAVRYLKYIFKGGTLYFTLRVTVDQQPAAKKFKGAKYKLSDQNDQDWSEVSNARYLQRIQSPSP